MRCKQRGGGYARGISHVCTILWFVTSLVPSQNAGIDAGVQAEERKGHP